jgi:hypothetical protein
MGTNQCCTKQHTVQMLFCSAAAAAAAAAAGASIALHAGTCFKPLQEVDQP